MSFLAFAIAVAVLLLTLGPTNTLLALAGAEQDAMKALRLVPFEAPGSRGGTARALGQRHCRRGRQAH